MGKIQDLKMYYNWIVSVHFVELYFRIAILVAILKYFATT